MRKTHIAGSAKPVEIYSLDAILAVGFRVRASRQAIAFRRWANQILKQYLISGFVIDVPRLENPDGRPDHFEELLSKVRHIRSSEKRMWTRVLELASFCSDYGMMTDKDRDNFFATVQNAMHWSVTQKTAAEVIFERVEFVGVVGCAIGKLCAHHNSFYFNHLGQDNHLRPLLVLFGHCKINQLILFEHSEFICIGGDRLQRQNVSDRYGAIKAFSCSPCVGSASQRSASAKRFRFGSFCQAAVNAMATSEFIDRNTKKKA